MVKANPRKPDTSREDVQIEFERLAKLHERLDGRPGAHVRVPRPLGSLAVNGIRYCVESRARGTNFCLDVWQEGYFKSLEKVRKDFSLIMCAATEIAQAMNGVGAGRSLDPAWLEVPAELAGFPSLAEKLDDLRYFSPHSAERRPRFAQHGDFTVENLFLDRDGGLVEVVDWAEVTEGLPPLYDHFALIFSAADLAGWSGEADGPCRAAAGPVPFPAILFPQKGVAQLIEALLSDACQGLHVAGDLLPALLFEFLIIRTHYYSSQRSMPLARKHLNILHFCLQHS